ncbi:MAG: cell division protein FtsA [Bacteroides sp.]|nr:cell division protein FtsA [Bacteroides sp.]
MSEERYIAAIEISSSKILGAVGKTTGEGQLEVIAIEQDRGVDGVRYGIIQNLEETSLRVARVIDKLQKRAGVAPRLIKGVFVGLSGRSLKSIPTTVSINLPDDTEINDEILDRLRNDAIRTAIDNTLEVTDAVPRIYKVGKTETTSPKGTVGNRIQGTYDLIVCRPEMKRNLERTIHDKLGIRVEGYIVTALATGHLLLSSDEKRLGCLLADIGAETTTVTIYSKGYLRYFATLPMGGRNITRDLQSLGIVEEYAEDIKKTSGNAIAPDFQSSLNIDGIKMSDVSNLIVARTEEILANVVEQVEYSGLKDGELPSKVITIGGGSRLQNINELLSKLFNLPVVRGRLPKYVIIDDPKATSADVEELVSVLYVGATHRKHQCLEEPAREELPVVDDIPPAPDDPVVEYEPEERPAKKKRGWWTGLQIKITNIFSAPEDESDILD